MSEEKKRIFFGIELQAPWPEKFPAGRMLESADRHLTLAFLGNANPEPLLTTLKEKPPQVPFKVGSAGYFDKCLFLSPRNPNVVAWGLQWSSDPALLKSFQKTLVQWLQDLQYSVDHPGREWLPHATIARRPFDRAGWEKSFHPIPFITSNLHLYESVGKLRYVPLWSYPIKPPFEEIEHTADIAFQVHGHTLQDVYKHAQTALAFKHLPLLKFMSDEPIPNLDEGVIALNKMISKADQESGCPFKAVSFHGDLIENPDRTFSWEMIVDV